MAALDFLKNVVDDLLTLEVATLTNSAAQEVSLQRDIAAGDKAKLNAAEQAAATAREELVNSIGGSDRAKVKKARDVLREKEKNLKALRMALGVYAPTEVFEKIRTELGTSEKVQLVAYSRFEIEGDAINFVTNNEALQPVAALHSEMVEGAQAYRKALYEALKSIA